MNVLVPARARHLARYREIATILAKHGLGWVVIQLGLGDLVPFQRGLLGHAPRDTPYTQAEHFRMVFEELGVTFIKLGQILSTRADILPSAYVVEFSKLQDAAPPIPYAQVRAVIERELGAPPTEIFAEFEPTPRASASIGQAHAARLANGAQVIVKVQRPQVEELVERDLEVLMDLARFAARNRVSVSIDAAAFVEEFAFTLRNELDYTREGQNADRIRRNFANEPALYVPKVYWDLTTPRVLTLEEIRGVKINDLAGLDAAGLDRHRVAENSVRIMLTEVFEHGFFHADPHPGNFFVLSDDVWSREGVQVESHTTRQRDYAPAEQALAARQARGETANIEIDPIGPVIGLLDFGMVGRIDEQLRGALVRMGMALVRRDTDRIVDELLVLGLAHTRVNRAALKRDLDHFIGNYYDRPIKELAARRVLDDLVRVAQRHQLQFPSDLMLLFKVIAMSEGLGIQLDPNFKLLAFAEPYFRKFWLEQRSPSALASKLGQTVLDTAELASDLPHRLNRLLSEIERGDVTITVKHEGLEEMRREVERSANRVTMGILTAALIVGTAIVMSYYHPSGWENWSAIIFTTAFVVGVVFAARLLWIIWRTGRR